MDFWVVILICSPHLTDFGAMSAVWVCKTALLHECLLASRLACSPHLTDFGVCLRIELACLLADTALGQEKDVYLRLVGRGIFVQRSEKAVAKSLRGCLLSDRYKMDGEEEVQTRWDKARFEQERLMMGSL